MLTTKTKIIQPSSTQINKANILKIIAERGAMPRQKIAKLMGLTPATITNLTTELMKEGHIQEAGLNQGEKGRKGPKSINLDVVDDLFWTIGLHIKYKIIEIACVNLKGSVSDLTTVSYNDDLEQDEFISFLKRVVKEYITKHSDTDFSAVGIGSFGLVNNDQGTLVKVKHFPNWHHLKLRTELEKEIQLPILVSQHIQAMTVAEKRFNYNTIAKDFLVVYVSKGIGAGIFINGMLYQGGSQLAHTNYIAGGKKCWCGQEGCVEQYVSEVIIFQELGVSDIGEIKQMVSVNDIKTERVLFKYGQVLGTAIASFLQMIPMEQIVLHGSLFFDGSPMVEGIKDKVNNSMNYYEYSPTFIESKIDDKNIGVLGASSVIARSDVLESIL